MDAFPNLNFIDPVKMVAAPRSDWLYVLGKDGYVSSTVNNATKTLVMDIRTRVQSTDNAGLTGLAFHPEFGLPGSTNASYFYVMYYYTPTPLYLPATDTDADDVLQRDETINHTCIRLSRFTMNPDGLDNLPEWALGSDSLAPSSTVLPTYTRIGNIVRYTVPKRPTNDALLTPETSPNLQSWNPTDPTIQITEPPTSYTFEAPLPTSGKLFLRLRATLP